MLREIVRRVETNVEMRVSMRFWEMGIEIISIILMCSLWVYQVYVQTTIGDYVRLPKESLVIDSKELFQVPVNGVLVFILFSVLLFKPQRIPHLIPASDARFTQSVYRYFVNVITFTKINVLAYLNVLSYSQSKSALTGSAFHRVEFMPFVYVEVIIVGVYVWRLLNLGKQQRESKLVKYDRV